MKTSTETPHVARWSPDAAADGQGAWRVSWLPLRLLTRDQAMTAMTLAETVGRGIAPGDPMWPRVENRARELYLTGPDAVVLVTGEAG